MVEWPARFGEEQQERRRSIEALWESHALRFAKGESSSLPIETAQELLYSILYTLSLRLRAANEPHDLLLSTPVGLLFEQGQADIARLLKRGRRLLSLARGSAVDIPNRAYRDTLVGVGRFFTRYDPLFFAHEIPGDIDYPLCIPVPESLLGVEFINEYLLRLWLENRLVGRLERSEVTLCLERISPEHEELLLSLYDCSLPAVERLSGMALQQESIEMMAATVCGRLRLGARDRDYLLAALRARLPYVRQKTGANEGG